MEININRYDVAATAVEATANVLGFADRARSVVKEHGAKLALVGLSIVSIAGFQGASQNKASAQEGTGTTTETEASEAFIAYIDSAENGGNANGTIDLADFPASEAIDANQDGDTEDLEDDTATTEATDSALVAKVEAAGYLDLTAEDLAAVKASNPYVVTMIANYEAAVASGTVLTEAEQIVADILATTKANLEKLGASPTAAESVATQEVKVFLGTERGEIVGEEENGACIIKTQEGKYLSEFTKTTLEVGQTPEESQEAIINGLCDSEGGVNVPAVASYMAMIEALKNNVSVNENFNQVFSPEQTQKYVDAMKAHPDLAQAYLQTVTEYLESADFSKGAQDVSGRTDMSVYADTEGKISVVSVTNKDGTSAVIIKIKAFNLDGEEVWQEVEIGKCNQPRVHEQAPAPQPEVPETPEPAEPVPAPETFKATYCSGLDENNQPIYEEVTGYATQEEANQAALEKEEDCEVEETTTTTVTTTTPTTTTTTEGTTTTTTEQETTTTAPDKETTTTVVQPTDPPATTIDTNVPTSRPPATGNAAEQATPSSSIPEVALASIISVPESVKDSRAKQIGLIAIVGLGLALRAQRSRLRKKVA